MKDIQISEDYVPKIKHLFKNKHIHSQNGNHDCVVITQETPLVIKETRLFLNKLSLNPLRFTLGPYDIKCRVGDVFFLLFSPNITRACSFIKLQVETLPLHQTLQSCKQQLNLLNLTSLFQSYSINKVRSVCLLKGYLTGA